MKSGWVTKRLGEVCEIKRGGSPRPIKDFITSDDDGLNWIKIGDVDPSGKYITATAEKIKRSGLKKTRQVFAGDFLLSNSMSYGRPYILRIDGCIHDGWLVLRGFKDVFDENFFYHLLRSDFVQSQFNQLAYGAIVSNLNSESVAKVEVPIAPLPEQHRIVAKIDAAFAKIDRLKANAEKNLANAKELFQSALNEVLRPKPGWVEKRLNEVFNFIDYRGKTPTKITSGVPLITAKNIRMGYLDYSCKDYISEEEFETRKSRGIARKGDLLFTTEAPLGFVAMADKEVFSTGQRVITFQQYAKSSFAVLNRFYFYYLQSAGFQDEVKRLATGATAQGIKASRLKDINVYLPPIDAQAKIAQGLDVLSKSCATLQSNYTRLIADCAEMRQAVLKEAFEGRL